MSHIPQVPVRLRKVVIKGFKTHLTTTLEISDEGGDLHCIEGEIDSGKTSIFAAIEMVATNAAWPEKYLHDDDDGVKVKSAEITLEFDMPCGGVRRITRTRTASSGSVKMVYEDGTETPQYTKVSDKEVTEEVQNFTGFKPFDLDSKTTVLLQRSMATNPSNPLGNPNISPETLMRRLATLSGSGAFEAAKATIKTSKNRLAGQLVEARTSVASAQVEVLSLPTEQIETLSQLGLSLQDSIRKWHTLSDKVKAAERLALEISEVAKERNVIRQAKAGLAAVFDLDGLANLRKDIRRYAKLKSEIAEARRLATEIAETAKALKTAKAKRDALQVDLAEAKKSMTLKLCNKCGNYCVKKVAA